MLQRYVMLALGIAFLHTVLYFCVFLICMTEENVPIFVGIMLEIMGIPLIFLASVLSVYFPAFARWFHRLQGLCGAGANNNFLIVFVACNSLIWGVTIALLIRWVRNRRKNARLKMCNGTGDSRT